MSITESVRSKGLASPTPVVLLCRMSPAVAVQIAPPNPLIEAVRRAPRVLALTSEQRAELDQDVADIAAGRVQLVAHDDVPAWLESRAHNEG